MPQTSRVEISNEIFFGCEADDMECDFWEASRLGSGRKAPRPSSGSCWNVAVEMSASMRRLTGPRMGGEAEAVREAGGMMQPSAMPALDEKCAGGVVRL